ncbi:MAG: histidine phosphatase family protein [Devosia sp.]
MTSRLEDPATPRIYFIRHGETAWSLSGQHTGHTDLQLTANGESQARQLARWLAATRFAQVLTSPRQRAGRTCELAGLGAVAKIDPDLAEWDYGDYDGLRTVDVHKVRPGWNVFRDGCPNGESSRQISDRCDRLIARLRLLAGNIAVFSHGQFGAVFAARWIGLPVIDGEHFSVQAASLGILGYSTDHPDRSMIELWNALPSERSSAFGLNG